MRTNLDAGVPLQVLPPLRDASAPVDLRPRPSHEVRYRHRPRHPARQRRRAVSLLLLGLLVGAAVPAGPAALRAAARFTSPSPQSEPVPVDVAEGTTYVVRRGDTLWGIARRLAPDSDPRLVVDALRAANGGADLQVGDELVLDLG